MLGGSVDGLRSAADLCGIAERCRTRFASDWALAIGDSSRPDDSEAAGDAPIVRIALAGHDGIRAVELNVAGDPAIVKSRVAKSALNLLRLKFLK